MLAAKQAELDEAKAELDEAKAKFKTKEAELDKMKSELDQAKERLAALARKVQSDIDRSNPQQPTGRFIQDAQLRDIEKARARQVFRLGEKFNRKLLSVLSPERMMITEKLAFFPELQVHIVEYVISRPLLRLGRDERYLVRVDGEEVAAGVRGQTVRFDIQSSRGTFAIHADGNVTTEIDGVFTA